MLWYNFSNCVLCYHHTVCQHQACCNGEVSLLFIQFLGLVLKNREWRVNIQLFLTWTYPTLPASLCIMLWLLSSRMVLAVVEANHTLKCVGQSIENRSRNEFILPYSALVGLCLFIVPHTGLSRTRKALAKCSKSSKEPLRSAVWLPLGCCIADHEPWSAVLLSVFHGLCSALICYQLSVSHGIT